MGWSQKEAAEALGLKRRVVQYYEEGERDGEEVKIPLSVRLACKALASGDIDYHGPSEIELKARQAERDKANKEKKKKKHQRKAQDAQNAASARKAS